MMHQAACGKLAKAEFMVGLMSAIAQSSARDKDYVKGMIAEVMMMCETVRALLFSAEEQATKTSGATGSAARSAGHLAQPVPEDVPAHGRDPAAAGFQLADGDPGRGHFSNEIAEDVARYFQLANLESRDRVALFWLAHDVCVSGFGSRQALYERFFGLPALMHSLYYDLYDKDPLIGRVNELIKADGLRSSPIWRAVSKGKTRNLDQNFQPPQQQRYDVVIVGGAMYGSSIAWWTASNPDFDGSILVVERDPSYVFASTSHTNSCIRQQFSNEINVRISQFGAHFVRNFRDFMGGDERVPDIVLQSFGYLYLADNQAFADQPTEPADPVGPWRGHAHAQPRADRSAIPVLSARRHHRRQPQPGRRGLFRRRDYL